MPGNSVTLSCYSGVVDEEVADDQDVIIMFILSCSQYSVVYICFDS